jgi:hypothetical protein
MIKMRYGVNINGEQIQRTPEKYPYSFDQYCVFKAANFPETTDTVYSDRMWEWSPEKFAACHVRAFDKEGQYFYRQAPEKIEKFLQYYFGIDLELTGIEIGCNCFNGYPYWVFYFKKNQPIPKNHLELNSEDIYTLKRRDELMELDF